MRCPDCGVEMKPLATSAYCPNDCDRVIIVEIDDEKTPKLNLNRDIVEGLGVAIGKHITDDDEAWVDSLLDGLFDGTD